jgi:hypothetical protein
LVHTLIIENQTGDKSILANPVILKEHSAEIKRSEIGGIYDMERGSTEVGFEHDLEPTKFGILTIHVEINRL